MIASEKNIINNAPIVSPHYEAIDVFPQTQVGAQGNSTQNITFELPSNARCINLSTMFLYLTFSITSNASNAQGLRFYMKKTQHMLQRIYMYTKSGQTICDTTGANILSLATPHMIRKNVSQFDRWEVYGQTDNQLVVAEPEYGFYLLQNDQVSPFLGPNGVYTFSLVLKLSDIYGSIFKINKNLPITEGTFIQLTIAPLDDWLYKSGNGGNNNYDTADLMYVHPPISLFSAVTVNNVLMSPAYTGTPLTFTTCKLRFSQIADDVLNGMAFEKVAMEKLVIPYEYITPMTYSQTGQNQTITHRINAAMGAKLRKIYHFIGNPPAMSSASREVRAATVRTSTKGAYQTGNNQFNSDLSSVQYQLDGRSLITYNILSMDYTVTDYGYPNDVSSYSQTYNADDGANVGKGGFSTRTVANNFYLCYSFEDSDPQKNGDNYNAGIDVRVSDRIYNILVGLTQNLSAGSTLNHYVFTVCTKYLVIDGKSMSSVSSLSSLNL